MKSRTLIIFFSAVAISAILSGCTARGVYQESGEASIDGNLARLVEQRIQNDPIAGRAMVRVSVRDGIATIHGREIGPAAMARIMSITRNTPGVRGVAGSRLN